MARYNKNNSAVKRIMQEARELANDPSTEYSAAPLEDNLFDWHCTLRGPSGTEFESGLYHFRIVLPAEYPFRPPSVMMLTPSGRFELNTKICISFTNYHEELWQPAWGVRTAIIGLQGFFPLKGTAAVGVGSVEAPASERRRLAKLSREWVCPHCDQANIESLPDPPVPTTAASSSTITSEPSGNGKGEESRVSGETMQSKVSQAQASGEEANAAGALSHAHQQERNERQQILQVAASKTPIQPQDHPELTLSQARDVGTNSLHAEDDNTQPASVDQCTNILTLGSRNRQGGASSDDESTHTYVSAYSSVVGGASECTNRTGTGTSSGSAANEPSDTSSWSKTDNESAVSSHNRNVGEKGKGKAKAKAKEVDIGGDGCVGEPSRIGHAVELERETTQRQQIERQRQRQRQFHAGVSASRSPRGLVVLDGAIFVLVLWVCRLFCRKFGISI